ncbi:MAG: CapA family protein [Solirubrobacteraceae bacterium]
MRRVPWRDWMGLALLVLSSRIVLFGLAGLVGLGLLAAVLLSRGPTPPTATADDRPRLPPGAPLTIVWGGDVTLGSSHGDPPRRGRALLRSVRSRLRAADIAALNLEGTFGRGGTPKCNAAESSSCFAFQAPPRNAGTLRDAGVDIVNLANNHAWDYGADGMGQTVRALQRKKVAYTGRPGEIRYLRRSDSRVAFVGFSSYPWSSPIRDPVAVRALISEAAARANVVVAFIHAGAEGQDQIRTPDRDEEAYGELRGNTRAFARVAIDAGADLVLGSGPHVLRGLEVYRGRLIAYSLGNLAGWKNFSLRGNAAVSGLLTVRIGRTGRFLRGRLLPLRLQEPGIPVRDPSGSARALVARVSRADFGKRAPTMSPAGRLHPR